MPQIIAPLVDLFVGTAAVAMPGFEGATMAAATPGLINLAGSAISGATDFGMSLSLLDSVFNKQARADKATGQEIQSNTDALNYYKHLSDESLAVLSQQTPEAKELNDTIDKMKANSDTLRGFLNDNVDFGVGQMTKEATNRVGAQMSSSGLFGSSANRDLQAKTIAQGAGLLQQQKLDVAKSVADSDIKVGQLRAQSAGLAQQGLFKRADLMNQTAANQATLIARGVNQVPGSSSAQPEMSSDDVETFRLKRDWDMYHSPATAAQLRQRGIGV